MEIGVSFNICYKTNFWACFESDWRAVYVNEVQIKVMHGKMSLNVSTVHQ